MSQDKRITVKMIATLGIKYSVWLHNGGRTVIASFSLNFYQLLISRHVSEKQVSYYIGTCGFY